MSFTPAQLDEIRARVSLYGTVVRTVQLKQKGNEWQGLCPFHSEKTPSFTVSEEKGFYHCFGCGAHGDVIGFLMQSQGLSFPDAVRDLAQQAGVDLDSDGVTDRQPQAPRGGFTTPKKGKAYKRPEQPKNIVRASRGTEVEQYLRGERGLTPDTIAAFKIGQGASYDGISAKTKKAFAMPGPWIVFPYLRFDKDGKIGLVNVKWLHVEREDGKKRTMQAKDAEPTLFGWHLIPDHQDSVIIGEGEINAMTWHQLGQCALATPMGAGPGAKQDWIDHDWDRLERFKTIFLNFDPDEPGALAEAEVVRRLGSYRCRLIRLPHKDVNDCVAKEGMTAADVAAFVANAESLQPATLRSATEFKADVVQHFYPSDEIEAAGIPVPWGPAGAFALRSAEVTMGGGITGHGKSILSSQLSLLSIDRGKRVCIASMEMRPKLTLERLYRQAAGKERPTMREIDGVADWLDGKLWIYNVLGTTTPDALMEAFLYAARRFGCWLFIVDSLMRCGISDDDYQGQSDFVKRLCSFVEQEGVHVWIIIHPRKAMDESKPPSKLDAKGSGGMADNVYNAVQLWRNKSKEKRWERVANDPAMNELQRQDKLATLRNLPDAYLIIDKQRVRSWEGSIKLWYDARTATFRASRDGPPPMLLTLNGDAPDDEMGSLV